MQAVPFYRKFTLGHSPLVDLFLKIARDFLPIALLARWNSGRAGLGSREVAGDAIFRHVVDDDLIGDVCPADVELHRLLNRPVFFLDAPIVGDDVESEGEALGVDAAKLELDGADVLRRFGLRKIEFEYIALA